MIWIVHRFDDELGIRRHVEPDADEASCQQQAVGGGLVGGGVIGHGHKFDPSIIGKIFGSVPSSKASNPSA